MGYHVSDANSYLVITGGGISDVKIVKKSWVMPWQKYSTISISPFDFQITLQAMTVEKLQFSLPAVFTIGPDDRPESLRKYAKILTGGQSNRKQAVPTGRNHVQDIVKGIIEGETRVIVSGMTMEEIFKERQLVKDKVIENVQGELDKFGLQIYNANVKELQDTAGSEYFKFLSRKAHEGASNQAKVDVANACMMGEIGEAEKKGKTKQEISKIDAETAVLETKRKSEKATADAELTTTQTKLNMGIKLANIQAGREADAKDAELQKLVEVKRAEMELEKMRATDLVKATIKKESAQQSAEAKLFTETKEADGLRYKQKQDAEARLYTDTKGQLYMHRQDAEAALYRKTKDAEASLYAKIKAAEAISKEADASFYAKNKDADAVLYAGKQEAEAIFIKKSREAEAELIAQKKQAEGTTEMAKAYRSMAEVLGGPQGLLQYMMLRNHTYENLANANATAINGLNPKITVWNTGDNASSSNDGTGAIRNIMQSLPPLLTTINEQTGIAPPGWLAQMGSGQEVDKFGNGKGKTNGVKEGK